MATVRKHPRTLQEAFGPHTSNVITEDAAPTNWWAWVIWAAVLVGAVWILV